MNTQSPEIYFCETPGGTSIPNGGKTSSRKVFLSVRYGPADARWELVRNITAVQPFTFNSSGAATEPFDNLDPGMNFFQLREHSSSLPISTWGVLVEEATEKLTIDSIKGLISGKEILDGDTTSETLFAMSGKARKNSTIYLRIDGVRQPGLIAVDGNGNWTYNTGTQAAGFRSYAIEGNYDSGPVSAPPRTLTIINTVSGQENFEAESPRKFNINQIVTFRSGLKLTILSTQGSPELILNVGTPGYEHWGRISFWMEYPNKCRFTFPGQIRSIYFDKYSPVKGQLIDFYDLQGKLIESVSVPRNTVNDSFSYTTPSSTLISYFELLTVSSPPVGQIGIDNLKWS